VDKSLPRLFTRGFFLVRCAIRRCRFSHRPGTPSYVRGQCSAAYSNNDWICQSLAAEMNKSALIERPGRLGMARSSGGDPYLALAEAVGSHAS